MDENERVFLEEYYPPDYIAMADDELQEMNIKNQIDPIWENFILFSLPHKIITKIFKLNQW